MTNINYMKRSGISIAISAEALRSSYALISIIISIYRSLILYHDKTDGGEPLRDQGDVQYT